MSLFAYLLLESRVADQVHVYSFFLMLILASSSFYSITVVKCNICLWTFRSVQVLCSAIRLKTKQIKWYHRLTVNRGTSGVRRWHPGCRLLLQECRQCFSSPWCNHLEGVEVDGCLWHQGSCCNLPSSWQNALTTWSDSWQTLLHRPVFFVLAFVGHLGISWISLASAQCPWALPVPPERDRGGVFWEYQRNQVLKKRRKKDNWTTCSHWEVRPEAVCWEGNALEVLYSFYYCLIVHVYELSKRTWRGEE